MAVARLALTSFADGEVRLIDEVELYQRTYTTLLRSSGETQLRVLEPSHMAMGSSLHPLAASEELDLGAFLYAVRRLPDGIAGAHLVVMGQDVEALTHSGIPVDSWQEAEAPARRRRWYDSGTGTLAVLLASASDVDDLVPTLVAFQIEWNKIRGQQLAAVREGRSEESWENFLYFVARLYCEGRGREGWAERRDAERQRGVAHLRSKTALRVPAQVIPLAVLDPQALDPRLGEIDSDALARSGAVIVNIDYPLGVAAYNILREVAVDRTGLRGVYVLGKAATLNADVGDVMISSVVHDEHSGSTYRPDNAFSVDDLAPDLRFGTGLDNQRAVTVKSTFLQHRSYLDFYYREAFTVVEMEAGPYCNAVYEIADADRHPVGEAVNFSKLPIDLGIIHYASDTPYTQARTLGARGLSYYGMASTYASSVAILRRILRLEGALT